MYIIKYYLYYNLYIWFLKYYKYIIILYATNKNTVYVFLII